MEKYRGSQGLGERVHVFRMTSENLTDKLYSERKEKKKTEEKVMIQKDMKTVRKEYAREKLRRGKTLPAENCVVS